MLNSSSRSNVAETSTRLPCAAVVSTMCTMPTSVTAGLAFTVFFEHSSRSEGPGLLPQLDVGFISGVGQPDNPPVSTIRSTSSIVDPCGQSSLGGEPAREQERGVAQELRVDRLGEERICFGAHRRGVELFEDLRAARRTFPASAGRARPSRHRPRPRSAKPRSGTTPNPFQRSAASAYAFAAAEGLHDPRPTLRWRRPRHVRRTGGEARRHRPAARRAAGRRPPARCAPWRGDRRRSSGPPEPGGRIDLREQCRRPIDLSEPGARERR